MAEIKERTRKDELDNWAEDVHLVFESLMGAGFDENEAFTILIAWIKSL